MNENKENVPKIRFPEFTDAWRQRKLEDITVRVTRKNKNLESTLPLTISAQDGLMNQNEFFNKTVASQDVSGYYLVKNGEFAYNKSYSNGYPWGAVKRLDRYDMGVLSTLYIVFKPTDINSDFLAKYYDTIYWYREVSKHAAEGARNHGLLNIAASEFFKTELTIPIDKEEQAKIGEFFTSLDHLITLHQRKLNNLKNLKVGLLQKMFPKDGEDFPEVRFPGFTDAWERRRLKDFGKATGGTSIESEFVKNGKYKVISIGSYSESSVYTDQNIRADLTEKTEKRILNQDDLTMILNDKTASGNIIGRVLLIDRDDSYIYNQRTERIEPDHEKYDSQFLYQLLNAPMIRSKIIKKAQGNTQIYVNWTAIRELIYLVPNIDEQRKVGAFFSNLDHLITLHQRKLEHLKEQKKALLQQMFV